MNDLSSCLDIFLGPSTTTISTTITTDTDTTTMQTSAGITGEIIQFVILLLRGH